MAGHLNDGDAACAMDQARGSIGRVLPLPRAQAAVAAAAVAAARAVKGRIPCKKRIVTAKAWSRRET